MMTLLRMQPRMLGLDKPNDELIRDEFCQWKNVRSVWRGPCQCPRSCRSIRMQVSDLARTDLASRQIAIDAERFNESQTSPHSAISRHSRLRGGLCVGFCG